MRAAGILLCLCLPTSMALAGFTTFELGPGDEFTVQDDSGTPLLNVDSAGNVFAHTSPFLRIVIVRPVGTETDNGQALLDAMAGITTATAANPFLVHIEPGIYDLAGTTLQVKSHVDLQGSGQDSTVIRGIGNTISTTNGATVRVLDQSEVRNLAIENTGGDDFAVGYYAEGHSVLRDVTIRVSGATDDGFGVHAPSCDSLLVDGVTVEVSGSTNSSFGANFQFCTEGRISNSTISARDGGASNFGVATSSDDTLITGVTATAAGPGSATALATDRSNTVVRDSRLTATSTGSTSRGINIFDGGGGAILYTVEVHGSRVSGGSAAAHTTTETDALFGASQLDGGIIGTGNKTCAGVYDGGFTFFAGTCP